MDAVQRARNISHDALETERQDPPVNEKRTPLLTSTVHDSLLSARRLGAPTIECSLDLERTARTVEVGPKEWGWDGERYPYMDTCRERTIYYWSGADFQPAARYTHSHIKLVPTLWGAPTFEIDGIKMLPSARVSPYADAEYKVSLIQPRGKCILDTCAGLGYFAAWCLRGKAAQLHSFEKNRDVLWLRTLNPWSPDSAWSAESTRAMTLAHGDITERIRDYPGGFFDAILHDPPRFGIAGELYSQNFYDQLARVLKSRGRLFHYTGAPNRLTTGRNVPNEVARRLKRAGFTTELRADGVLAQKGAAR
jgi:predicted methyltransferase